MKTVLVIGAGGFFGRLLVEELLQSCQCKIILAGRNVAALNSMREAWSDAWKERTEVERVDVENRALVETVVPRCQIAVLAAGPFQHIHDTVFDVCRHHKVHYIDLSDDRKFVSCIFAVVNDGPPDGLPTIATGWSTVPVLSALLVTIATCHMERIERIRVQIAPGNRAPRGYATVASLLDSLGKRFELWRNNKWETVTGWSEPAEFAFPEPVGRRTGALVDVPDLALFPPLFNASCVEFRAGANLKIFNHVCSVLAQLRKAKLIKSWQPFADPAQKAMALFGSFGNDAGALGVEVTGLAQGKAVTRKACIVADNNGHHIPVMPAAILVEQLLQGDKEIHGTPPLKTWLTRNELEAECRKRNYRLVVDDEQTAQDNK